MLRVASAGCHHTIAAIWLASRLFSQRGKRGLHFSFFFLFGATTWLGLECGQNPLWTASSRGLCPSELVLSCFLLWHAWKGSVFSYPRRKASLGAKECIGTAKISRKELHSVIKHNLSP